MEFPRSVKRKQYSAVPPSDLYQSSRDSNTKKKLQTDQVTSQPAMPIGSGDEVATSSGKSKTSFWSEEEKREDHDGAEDWERHESFNNDVGTQVGY